MPRLGAAGLRPQPKLVRLAVEYQAVGAGDDLRLVGEERADGGEVAVRDGAVEGGALGADLAVGLRGAGPVGCGQERERGERGHRHHFAGGGPSASVRRCE